MVVEQETQFVPNTQIIMGKVDVLRKTGSRELTQGDSRDSKMVERRRILNQFANSIKTEALSSSPPQTQKEKQHSNDGSILSTGGAVKYLL